MNKNTWDVNKDMTVKEQVTKRLVERFPCCCGKQLMLITSLSFTELKQFLSQGKINGDSYIYNVDNLASDNMFGDEKPHGSVSMAVQENLEEKGRRTVQSARSRIAEAQPSVR